MSWYNRAYSVSLWLNDTSHRVCFSFWYFGIQDILRIYSTVYTTLVLSPVLCVTISYMDLQKVVERTFGDI